MKTKVTFLGIALLAVIFVRCDKNAVIENVEPAVENDIELATAKADSCTYSDDITQNDIAGLLAMREEEKLAHDVYISFYEQFGVAIFKNIAKSEASHTEAVLNLLIGYGLEDPAIEGIGMYRNPEFTELFETLAAQGIDIIEALKTGALIEELDIKDLMEWIETTESDDIKRVYNNLLKGSGNHLRAFVSQLNNNGEIYEPVILSTGLYNGILSGQNENKGKDSKNSENKISQNKEQKGHGQSGNQSAACDETQSGNANGSNRNRIQDGNGSDSNNESGTAKEDGSGKKNGTSKGKGNVVADGAGSGPASQTQTDSKKGSSKGNNGEMIQDGTGSGSIDQSDNNSEGGSGKKSGTSNGKGDMVADGSESGSGNQNQSSDTTNTSKGSGKGN